MAAKGIQRNSLNSNLLATKLYKDVLFRTGGKQNNDGVMINKIPMCENRGFRKSREAGILTYRLTKRAQTPLYIKLRVLNCKSHCMPFELKTSTKQLARCDLDS